MEHTSDTNWQAPPAFLLQQLVALLIERDLRWALHIADMRLISRDWRRLVDGTLPVLSPNPSRHLVDYALVAALVPRFPGLRYLNMQSPITPFVGSEERALALSAIGSSCTALRCLRLPNWVATPEAVRPLCLSSLPHLAILHLPIVLGRAGLNDVAVGALRQLPRLRCLQVECSGVDSNALATLCHLTSLRLNLRLPATGALPQLPALARLTRLRRLGLEGCDVCCASPELSHLAALPLTCLEFSDTLIAEQDVSPALLQLLHSLGASGGASGSSSSGGSSGRGGGVGGLRRLRLSCQLNGNGAELLPFSALSGLEALHISYPGLEVSSPSQVSCLTRLTELGLELRAFRQHEEQGRTVSALVAAVGRRLPALRQLNLQQAQRVSEAALEELAGLTQLTALSVLDAHDFGRRALAALSFLTSLQRLSLSHISLSLPSLGGPGGGVGAEAAGAASEEEEEDEYALPPQLTYLSLQDCGLLSPASLARLATTAPALKHLVHCGAPALRQPHLDSILRGCSRLQLLQTTWHPATAPPDRKSVV